MTINVCEVKLEQNAELLCVQGRKERRQKGQREGWRDDNGQEREVYTEGTSERDLNVADRSLEKQEGETHDGLFRSMYQDCAFLPSKNQEQSLPVAPETGFKWSSKTVSKSSYKNGDELVPKSSDFFLSNTITWQHQNADAMEKQDISPEHLHLHILTLQLSVTL